MTIEELQKVKDSFITELTTAYLGEKTSLPFIRQILPKTSLVAVGDTFQVLVVGGTNVRSVVGVEQEVGYTELTNTSSTAPIFKTKEEFFSFLLPFIDSSAKVISLNFAFALKPVTVAGITDGELIQGSKEHTFDGLIGRLVGKELSEYIHQKKGVEIPVAVANDTVCLLLSGLTVAKAENLAAGIVGTGLNFAFFLDASELVNLEAANFDTFEKTAELAAIDQTSANPGKGLFEKATAGGYLYKLYNERIVTQNLSYPQISSTEELNAVLEREGEGYEIAKELFENSAGLIACQIAGITEYKKQDMVFVMEGSLFCKSAFYKQNVEKYLSQLTSYKVDFQEISDDSVKGAAALIGVI